MRRGRGGARTRRSRCRRGAWRRDPAAAPLRRPVRLGRERTKKARAFPGGKHGQRGTDERTRCAPRPDRRRPRSPPARGCRAGANGAGLLARGSVARLPTPARVRSSGLRRRTGLRPSGPVRRRRIACRASYSGGAAPDSHRLPIGHVRAMSKMNVISPEPETQGRSVGASSPSRQVGEITSLIARFTPPSWRTVDARERVRPARKWLPTLPAGSMLQEPPVAVSAAALASCHPAFHRSVVRPVPSRLLPSPAHTSGVVFRGLESFPEDSPADPSTSVGP
jgi:hypothetical protein